jgi:hypothetical protein
LFTCGTCVSGEEDFKDLILASFCGFSLPVWKIFRISEPFEQILMKPTQGTFLQKFASKVLKFLKRFLKKC